MKSSSRLLDGVFINCPFDEHYKPLFDALVFCTAAAGLRVRSALERVDSGEARLEKICRLIGESAFSIHDISRVERNQNDLPRFNMPLELGIALGFRRFGAGRRPHRVLILDAEPYRYRETTSDLAGLDISVHGNEPDRVIACVRNFLDIGHPTLPSSSALIRLHHAFEAFLPIMADMNGQTAEELTFVDRVRYIDLFLARSEARP